MTQLDTRQMIPPGASSSPGAGIASAEVTPIDYAAVRRRAVGTSDLRVFPLAISGNVFGWTADDATCNSILDTYARFGGNFIDTADSYASGRSEIMIGNWMRARHNRDEMVVATKVGKSLEHPGLKARVLTQAVNDSLTRLGTDHIDLLYLHIDDQGVPFEETLFAVDDLVRAGKVRYFGASDHSANRLIEARVIAAQLDVTPMVALQNHYNLLHRAEFEGNLARVAAQQRLGVMPRFALASGFLTGKYRAKTDLARNARGPEVAKYLTKRNLRVLGVLDSIAAEVRAHGVPEATIGAVALAWLLTKRDVVAPVASASHAGQVRELLTAARIHLGRHQIADLDRASA